MNLIIYSYDESGNLKGSVNLTSSPPPPPIRLAWDFSSSELIETIEEAYNDALKMIEVRS